MTAQTNDNIENWHKADIEYLREQYYLAKVEEQEVLYRQLTAAELAAESYQEAKHVE